MCYTEKATEARHRLERQYDACADRKKQCRPNETKPYCNATHPCKRQNDPTNGHTPSRIKSTHTRLTSQGRGRTHPVTRRVTTQCLHTQSVTTRRRCGHNDKHEAPRELYGGEGGGRCPQDDATEGGSEEAVGGGVPLEWAGHLAGARFALRCWLCSASADVVMRRVYGALLVAMLVVC